MTLQIQIDDAVLADVDESLDVLHQSRDEFFKDAIERSVAKLKREADVSRMYQRAYSGHPLTDDEMLLDDEAIAEVWEDLPWEPKNEAR